MHDEIGSNLSSISLLSQILQKRAELESAERKKLVDIQRVSQQTSNAMRDIVWFINPDNDRFDRLVVKMRETANLMLDDLEFDFVAEKNLPDNTRLEFRRNLFLIYKEALQNIVKHAHASHVQIELSWQQESLHLLIQDNGVGVDRDEEFAGNGLKNLTTRAKALDGKLDIESEPGKGTGLRLRAKMD